MTDLPKYFIVRARSRVPFRHGPLPLITGLARMGFHQYKNRWAKRLGKRIGRLAFDTAYRLGTAIPLWHRYASLKRQDTFYSNPFGVWLTADFCGRNPTNRFLMEIAS